MSIVAHISDTHFGTERAMVVAALEARLATLSPDLVVLSGDITQRARRAQFIAARAFIDRLATPWLAIPGNHDIPLFDLFTRATRPYARYREAFGRALEAEFISDDLMVLGVNTTRPGRHKDGEVSIRQVERVSVRLRQASLRQLRVVVTHQPVFVTREQDVSNRLHGHDRAIHAWSEAGADIILGGHIHLPYAQPLRQRYDNLARDLWAVQAGTAVSRRVRDGIDNSFNLLRYDAARDGHGCRLERWDFHEASGDFRRVSDLPLLLDRPGNG